LREEWISKDSTFNALRDKMKAGETGSGKYKKGGETWFLAFAPVDPSVRARYSGDATSSYAADLLTYSVGITVPVKDIERPFDEIEESIDGALTGLLVFYFVALSLIILCILCVSHSIVGTLSRPILTLLSLVKRVNRKELDGDLPDMAGGSVEVSAIYGVFKQLYTVIRFSNDGAHPANVPSTPPWESGCVEAVTATEDFISPPAPQSCRVDALRTVLALRTTLN
jgi:hypothetical protein